MKMPIRKGGIFWVKDESLTMPPNDRRTYHPQRTVIIMSGDSTNQDARWPTVLVMPTSSESTLKTEFCVKLAAGQGNVQKKCWARVIHTQPFLKDDLGDYLGQLSAEVVASLEDSLFTYMGLID
jgi:mRNA-degrading endonuclease toxin of MazEF toxin-antitoxin module